jgi:hypothetical protein
MKAIILTLLLCVVSFLGGCGSTPTQQQIQNAYYGPYPANYEANIKDYMNHVLYDSQSAIYEFSSPYQGYGYRWTDKNGNATPFATLEFGWIVNFNINAKNRFGGYVGFTPYRVVIRDDKVVAEEEVVR